MMLNVRLFASQKESQVMVMFDTDQLSGIDPGYFNIILMDEYDVTIQSKNTGHFWYLHNTGFPTESSCIIFQKESKMG